MLLITGTGYAVIVFVAVITFLSCFENGRTFLKWLLWDFSGLRFTYRKIKPEKNEVVQDPAYRKPTTFFLWMIGIYIAAFGVASNRYENRIDIIENRLNRLYAQIPKDIHVAFQRINDVQKMLCPAKPKIRDPFSVIKSFWASDDRIYEEGVDQLKQLVEDWAQKTETIQIRLQREPDLKDDYRIKRITGAVTDEELNGDKKIGVLAGADLQGAYLEEANLWKSHLEGSNLEDVNLEGADLGNAHLEGAGLRNAHLERAKLISAHLERTYLGNAHLERADLESAHLEGADLRYACLEGANLLNADLEGANLKDADLRNACLCKADLKNVRHLNLDKLSQVFSLYGVQNLDSELETQIKQEYPHVLEPNNEIIGCSDEDKGEW
jgi:hypothetical protein